MPTVCLKFRFKENSKIKTLMDACASIQQQAVNFAIDNNKTATFTIIKALYPSIKSQFPNLHSQWLQSAVRSGAAVVHSFKNRKRKGKRQGTGGKGQGNTSLEKPKIKRPFVYVSKQILKVDWDGKRLTLTFPVSPYDKEPITLSFRPHHKYCRLLDDWKEGRAKMREPTLTFNSISIPIKFPEFEPYKPKTVIAVDSNELNLTVYVGARDMGQGTFKGCLREIDTSYAARISRDHERRVRKGTKGKQNPKAKRKVASKHGRIRKEKVKNFWHHIALMLIAWAMANKAAIVLEDLKGMKGRIASKHKSRRMRQRLLNFWSVMTFHKILAQKAGFYGVPLVFVPPENTSRTCPICGRVNERLRGHVFECPCGLKKGRHEVGAINIACKGLEFLGFVMPRQGLVGDPCRLSSDFGLKAQGHDRNTQPTA
ncbi:transposase, IS605 OrfB family, central region [Candidatus Fervidibacteria bacterium JGI MDM2 SSWTFF-3-K9]